MTLTRGTRGHGLLEVRLSQRRAAMANQLIPNDARSGSILDIGCGSFPLFLTETQFTQKFGLDRVTDADVMEQFKSNGIELRSFDLEISPALPFDDAEFNVVTMLAVIEHIEPTRLVWLAGEIRRVLKPGGSYILTTPASWTAGILSVLSALRLVSPEEIDEHKDAYSRKQIAEILTDGGFDRERVRTGSFELGANLWALATK